MNWFKGDKSIWKEIIETVAAEEHRSTQMVEKDTVQSMFLLELSKSVLPFVFKGGTSLSKAYELIDRFSEDIDLSMNRKPTESEKKKTKNTIIGIAEVLGLKLINPEDGVMWIIYGICIIGSWICSAFIGGDSIYSVIPLCIGTIIPILIMVFLHHKWVKRYFIQ